MSEPPKLPKELEAIADKVLAYRPKPKSKAAKKRKKGSSRGNPIKKSGH
jgi:hypothetical protein